MTKIKRPTGGVHCACSHCGEIFGPSGTSCALYCKDCKTAAQRADIDKQNEQILGHKVKQYV